MTSLTGGRNEQQDGKSQPEGGSRPTWEIACRPLEGEPVGQKGCSRTATRFQELGPSAGQAGLHVHTCTEEPSVNWTFKLPFLFPPSLPNIPSVSFPLRPWSSRLLSSHLQGHLKYLQRVRWAWAVGGCHPRYSHTSREDIAFRVVARLPWKMEKSRGMCRMGVHNLCAFWYCTSSLSCVPEGT